MTKLFASKTEALFLFAILAFLAFLSQEYFVLVHIISESLAIIVSMSIFIFTFNTRHLHNRAFFQILGVAYLFVGATDFLHTITYPGLDLLPVTGTNITLQYWMFARFLEVGSIFAASFFINKSIKFTPLFIFYSILSTSTLLLFLSEPEFIPSLFIENEGLTPLKITLEWIFCTTLLASMFIFYKKRAMLSPSVFRFLNASIVLTILSELAFTLYTDVYGVMALTGHFLKIISFYFMYKSIVEISIKEPYVAMLSHALKDQQITDKKIGELRDNINKQFNELSSYKKALDLKFIVSATDKNGVITFVNDNFCKLSKYRRSELIGSSHSIISSGYHDKTYYSNMWSQLLAKHPVTINFKNISKDGDLFWVTGVIVPLLDDSQNIERFIYIAYDNTKEILQKATIMQTQKMADIGEVTASILHDMSNPVSIISTATNLLTKKISDLDIDPDQQASIEKIITSLEVNSGRITSFFENMREQLASNEDGSTNIEKFDKHLKEIADQAFSYIQDKIAPDKIGFKNNIDKQLIVNIYPEQLVQVFVNLFSNSYEANRGSKSQWIDVEAELNEQSLVVRVTDSGLGIKKEHQEHIFTKLFSTKKSTGGTGLGMNICRKIIEAHNGNVRYNPDSKNTQFIITLNRKL